MTQVGTPLCRDCEGAYHERVREFPPESSPPLAWLRWLHAVFKVCKLVTLPAVIVGAVGGWKIGAAAVLVALLATPAVAWLIHRDH